MRWTGQIYIEDPGNYTFYLRSDDGSRLTIGGETIVDNDGLHADLEKSDTVHLDAGYHNIRVEMFENYGAAGVTLSWRLPGSATKEVVPSDVLFRDARGVLNITTDRDLLIPVGAAVVDAAGVGNVAAVVERGCDRRLLRLRHTSVFNRIPSFVDGNLLHNDAAAGQGHRDSADRPAHPRDNRFGVRAGDDRPLGRHPIRPTGPDGLRRGSRRRYRSSAKRSPMWRPSVAERTYPRPPTRLLRSGTDLGFGGCGTIRSTI